MLDLRIPDTRIPELRENLLEVIDGGSMPMIDQRVLDEELASASAVLGEARAHLASMPSEDAEDLAYGVALAAIAGSVTAAELSDAFARFFSLIHQP